jgi:hypothetical protein
LHWKNSFEEFFWPLKVVSLGTLVFRKAWSNFFCSTSNFHRRKLDVEQKNLSWAQLLICILEGSKRGQAKKKMFGLSWRSQVSCSRDAWEAKWQKKILSTSNFWHWKLEAKCTFLVFDRFSKNLKHAKHNLFCIRPPIFCTKSWRPNANVFALTSLETPKLGAREIQRRLR